MNLPTGQFKHAEGEDAEVEEEYLPYPQRSHECIPGETWYLPAWQPSQAL